MADEMHDVEVAALRFFRNVIRPKDRAELIVFSNEPQIKVPFTNDVEVMAGGLAELEAGGYTALWDSLVYSLYSFAGLTGKRVLVALTDGEDSRSEYRFDEVLDFAKRAGVAIYVIGLDVPSRAFDIRSRLQSLARSTGGETYYIQRAGELDGIYDSIEEEVHSQYLIAYQSTQGDGDEFRSVEVELSQPGLEARTIPGYYP
jgi:VWFA-related protein